MASFSIHHDGDKDNNMHYINQMELNKTTAAKNGIQIYEN